LFLIRFNSHSVLLDKNSDSKTPIQSANLLCSLTLEIGKMMNDHKMIASLPKELGVKLIAQLNSEKMRDNLKGFLKVEIGPFAHELTKGFIFLNQNIDLDQQPISSETQIGGDLEIKQFKAFSKLINSTDLFLIPSPLNSLEGTAQFKIDGNLFAQPLRGVVKSNFETHLKSQNQVFNLEADSEIKVNPCLEGKKNTNDVEIEVVAKKLHLQLPNIDYKKPPVLMPDSRFVLETQKKSPKKPSCPWRNTTLFRNPTHSPLLLSGPFLKKPLPISANIKIQSNKDIEGKISIQNFESEFFRRKTLLEFFNLDLKTKLVNAKANVFYTDYKVTLLLSGTLNSIHLGLESDPPLNRSQIVAVLLFGKTLDSLDETQGASVNHFDAAAKDGAMTLASLYLFSSTPVESVGYNPHTQGITAKVKLANGTTLNMGANEQGLTDIGLTRRLSKHWRINTSLRESDDNSGFNTAMTLLEWFTRF
jgi:hypothetical protein